MKMILTVTLMKTGKTLKNNQDNKTIAKRKGLKHRNIR